MNIQSLSKRPMINAWLSIPSPWIAEIFVETGYHTITLDLQHGFISQDTAVSMVQAVSNTPTMVRISWNDPAEIMKMLDIGVAAVICPMINNKEDAEKFVRAAKYPPKGSRSFGPIRAALRNADYFGQANEKTLAIVQIETKESVDNLSEILDVNGVDGVYIGTIDLSISMGLENPGDLNNPELMAVVKEIVNQVKSRGQILAIHTMKSEDIDKLHRFDFDIITPINDNSALQNQARLVLHETETHLRDLGQ